MPPDLSYSPPYPPPPPPYQRQCSVGMPDEYDNGAIRINPGLDGRYCAAPDASFFAGHHRGNTIQAKRNPTMGRRSVPKGLKQESKL